METETIQIRLDPDLAARLQELAEQEDTTPAALVKDILETWHQDRSPWTFHQQEKSS